MVVAMTARVALLRGINVGRAHQVPMADLRAVLGDLGLASVSTHGRSGNVVFASDQDAPALESTIAATLEDRFGFAVPVVTRTAEEIQRLSADGPFPDADPSRVQVTFLYASLTSAQAGALDDALPGSCPDQVVALDREIVVHHPDGVSRSALPRAVREILDGGTARNRRTVAALGTMLERL